MVLCKDWKIFCLQVQVYLIVFHFTALCRHCILYKSKVYGNPPSSKSTSTIFPIAFAHFTSLCVGKIPWRREWQPTPVFLPEKSHGLRSLTGTWDHKESGMTEHKAPWCHILVVSPFFKLSYYYYASYSELWPVIFDVTILIVLGLHKPCPYKTENIINKCYVCFDCSISQVFPIFLPFLGPPYSLRHINF